MGVDYVARKAAKKSAKRERGDAVPKRERKKKNQPRRLCRGPCFKPPALEVDDSDQEAAPRRLTGAGGELARYAYMDFSSSRKRKPATPSGDRPGKKPKMSTQVSLITPVSDDQAAAAKEKKKRRAVSFGADADAPTAELAALPEPIQAFFRGEGFSQPTPVQRLCWPHLLAGRDVEAVAEPGAGKTLAYLLPAAARLAAQGHGKGTSPPHPLALVLAPTRELAQQVAGVAKGLRKHCGGLRTACLTGGTEKEGQIEALEAAPHVVVATPGRLLDLIDDGHLSLDSVQYVVLDEADKMLSMGFADQIERIKGLLPTTGGAAGSKGAISRRAASTAVTKAAQVGLFTATMPPAVRAVAEAWLSPGARAAVALAGSAAGAGAAPGRAISATVVQVAQVCAEHKKPAKLLKHLAGIKAAAAAARLRHAPRVLVFANRIKTVRFVYKQVATAGYRAAQLHGERSQEERDAAVRDFKSGKAQVLVASDVAARGLDIANLPYVVNYDFPSNLETYVHRVGRAGRLAADGHAFSFLTRELAPLAGPLLRLLRSHDQAVDPNLVKLAEAYETAAKKLGLPLKGGGGGGRGGRKEEEEEEDRNAARPATEDVLRELDMKTKVQKKKDRAAEKRKAKKSAAAAAADSDDDDGNESDGEDSEGDEKDEPAAKKMKKTAPSSKKAIATAAAATPAADAQPEFIQAKKFGGARPGYVFKRGGMGVGYYVDRPPHKLLAELAKARKALAAKSAAMPIGGKTAFKAAKPAAKAVPLLPGRMKAMKKKQLADYSSSDEEGGAPVVVGGGGSDSDSDAPPAQASTQSTDPKKRRGSLPGRLRKKLAKDRQRQAGGA